MADKKLKESESTSRDWPKRLALWLGIVLTTVMIITSLAALIRSCNEDGESKTAQYNGVVRDVNGDPVANARIRIKSSAESGELLGSGTTRPNGQFNIVVQASPETTVWVTITKGGHVGFSEMQVLGGNRRLTFRRGP